MKVNDVLFQQVAKLLPQVFRVTFWQMMSEWALSEIGGVSCRL
jgi:hypothetical protein